MNRYGKKKLVNYILMCAFALLWIAAMVQYIRTDRGSSIQSMAGIVEDEKLENKGCVVKCRGMIDTSYYTEQEKTDWLINVAGILNVPADGSIEITREDNIVTVAFVREGANALADFKFITKETEISPEEISLVNYMDMCISVNGILDNALDYRSSFEALCEDIGAECEITVTYTGDVEGRLSESEMKSLSKGFLEDLSAKEVTSAYTEGNFDLYAYSESEEEYIVSNGERINVNIVMTYDEAEDKTKLYLCSPVINDIY